MKAKAKSRTGSLKVTVAKGLSRKAGRAAVLKAARSKTGGRLGDYRGVAYDPKTGKGGVA